MSNERMTGAQQENVLTLLCFDTEAAKIIRGQVDPALFESRVFQDIATHAINFLDQYGEAIKDHLPDVLEDTLSDKEDKRKATLYKRTLENLNALRDDINADYVITQLRKFVHEQTLKAAILKAVEKIEAGKVAEAEVELEAGLNSQIVSFDPGTFLGDTASSLAFLDTVDNGIPIGIKALDDAGITPAPGTMYLFVAPAKKGKSWFLTHVGKYCLLQRKKVLVITLEMSEALYSMRFIQSLFSVSKRDAKVMMPRFRRGQDGAFAGIDFDEVQRPTLRDANIKAKLERDIKERFKGRTPLIIKSFPTGSLTLHEYKAYLDQLERLHKFVPDVVLLDYPDLMSVDTDNARLELGSLFKKLRGVAVERNHALVCPTQGNRAAAEARTTTDTHVAEDYSKIATADTVVTYSQTADEKRLGLARLFVSNARSEEDKFTVLITQAYPIGQFAIESRRMGGDYWRHVDAQANNAPAPGNEAGDDE